MDTQMLMKNKKKKFWVLTAVTTVLAIAVITFVVLIAYKLPWKYDMTAQRLFTLTQQSETILATVDTPIQIGAVYPTGREEAMVKSLLDEYAKASDNITVEYIDAEQQPAKLAKYNLTVSAVTNGSIIVQSGQHTKIITPALLFTESTSGNLFNGEREISGAIRYVTAKDMPVVYFTQGHEEASPTKEMSQAASLLQLDAYEIKSVNLLKEGAVPSDADILVFASPKTDLDETELAMVKTYLEKGGKMMLMVDSVMNTNTITLPNLNSLTNAYGIDISNNYVVEEDTAAYLSASNLYLIPRYGAHAITQKIGEDKKIVILPVVRGLGTVDYDKAIVTLNPLLYSSEKSWVRADMTITATTKTEADPPGPIILAYAAVGSNVGLGNNPARVVVIGNSSFAYDGNLNAQANAELWTNSINWLQGDRNSDIIASKAINADRLLVRGNDFNKLAIICIGVLPLIAFACAFTVWILRRNQ